MGEIQETSQGFFVQEVPYKVFLEYTTAPRQKVISDGQSLWIYSVEKNEVIFMDKLTEIGRAHV